MTREEAIANLKMIGVAFVEPITKEQGKLIDDTFDMAIKALEQEPCEDCISRQAAIDALWKALYKYEDETEKQFIESDELDVSDWMLHRIFVQNMSDIDRQTILNLPSVKPMESEEMP